MRPGPGEYLSPLQQRCIVPAAHAAPFGQSPPILPLEDEPAGWVWQKQQAQIFSNVPEEKRWPRALERAKRYGVQSACHLPLSTARRRLGILFFACKQPFAYETADAGFLQLVANQVAVAVENAIAFQEIEALKDQLAEENAYLEEEVRTEHNFGELIGESAALRRVLKEAETVAPTGSTVLIRGESGTGNRAAPSRQFSTKLQKFLQRGTAYRA